MEVPEERVADAVERRLVSLGRTSRIQGFRPGKAPLRVIKQRFGARVRKEVVERLLASSFEEAVARERLRPAGMPRFDPVADSAGHGLSYTAHFEVMPEVKPEPVENLTVERPRCDISAADVDKTITWLRRRRRRFQPVERAAREGDQVEMDYQGRTDGKPLEGLEAAGAKVEIGAGNLISGMEDGLAGAVAGQSLELNLTFPDDYHRQELAGKPVTFQVQVGAVSEPVLPDLDEAFFQEFGVKEGGEEAFRREIRCHIEREAEVALRRRLRDSVMQALHDANKVEAPQTLVDAEARRVRRSLIDEAKARGVAEDLAARAVDAGAMEQAARSRVALRLLTAEIIRAEGLRPDPGKVRAIIDKRAENYKDAEALVNWYYGDEKRLAEIEALALEDEVIDWVLSRCRVTEKKLSFDELMNKGHTMGDETGAAPVDGAPRRND